MRERKKQVGRQDFSHITTVFIKFILKIAKFTCIFFFLNSLILEMWDSFAGKLATQTHVCHKIQIFLFLLKSFVLSSQFSLDIFSFI